MKPFSRLPSRVWIWFLSFSFIAGLLLRVLFVHDMEYKEDEEINFNASQLPANPLLWPPAGMPTGVYLQNPGLSVWIFTLLGKLIHATTPTQLATGLQIFSWLGIGLLLPFALYFVRENHSGGKFSAREPWLWSLALAMVNPITVFYQRKLWPEPFLPFFGVLMLMGFWTRTTFWGAFAWGVFGALLGQIHLSGFFFAGGFFLWTLLFKRHEAHWKGWFTGSVLGALPLIPWLWVVLKSPPSQSMGLAWNQIFQFKFWVFWLSNPLGLHLGNPLGLLRGESNLAQLSDFFRYPLLGATPTYLVGLSHLIIVACAFYIFGSALIGTVRAWRTHRKSRSFREQGRRLLGLSDPHSPKDETSFSIASALWGGGLLLTLTGVNIRRYYMMVNFPLDFVFLVRVTLRSIHLPKARIVLGLLFVCELLISGAFVHYIHVHEGAPQGDYGDAYHVVMKKRALNPAPPPPNQPWPAP